MVFSPAELSSWRLQGEASRTGERRERCPVARAVAAGAGGSGSSRSLLSPLSSRCSSDGQGTFSAPLPRQRGRNCCSNGVGRFQSILGPEQRAVWSSWSIRKVGSCCLRLSDSTFKLIGIWYCCQKRWKLDWTAELSFTESSPATLRLPTNNDGGHQTGESSWPSTSKTQPKRELLSCYKACHQWDDPEVLCFFFFFPRAEGKFLSLLHAESKTSSTEYSVKQRVGLSVFYYILPLLPTRKTSCTLLFKFSLFESEMKLEGIRGGMNCRAWKYKFLSSRSKHYVWLVWTW